jgi:hypothetical protein
VNAGPLIFCALPETSGKFSAKILQRCLSRPASFNKYSSRIAPYTIKKTGKPGKNAAQSLVKPLQQPFSTQPAFVKLHRKAARQRHPQYI